MNILKQKTKKILNFLGIKHANPLWWWLRMRGILRYDRKTKTFVRNILGHQMHLDENDVGLSSYLALHGTREPESVELMKRYVTHDMNILDLGANIGFFVLIEAGIIKKGIGRILAIEPRKENITLLELNVRVNNYEDRVQIVSGAITQHSGTVELALFDAHNSNMISELAGAEFAGPTETVKAYTLPELLKMAEMDNNQLDFLRMDVEGAEYLFMDSLLDTVRLRDRFLIFIELHPSPQNMLHHKKLLQELEKMDFQCLGGATKEYIDNGTLRRVPFPDATIKDLYTNATLLKPGGCEVFLGKGYSDKV